MRTSKRDKSTCRWCVSHTLRGRFQTCPTRRGLTIIEVLVSISIVGMLMALLLPAIQAARESGRNVTCQNHLRQLGLAMLDHEQSLRRFPTGGWGGHWVTDPERGSDARQPGGWVYSLFPYIQRSDIHAMGRDFKGAEKRAAITRLVQSPIAMFNCPSRRSADTYTVSFVPAQTPLEANYLALAARSDYAANAGDQERCEITAYGGPGSLEEGDDPAFPWPEVEDHTGIVYLRSQTQMAHIRDGKAHVYLLAEKYVPAGDTFNGRDHGDDWSMYTGYQDDICRTAYYPPLRDDLGLGGGVPECRFGAIHPAGFNAVFCDGAARQLSYDIDPEVHRLLGNRADNKVVDTSQLP